MKLISKLILSAVMSVLFLLPLGTAALASAPGDISGGIVKMTGDVYVNEGTTVTGDVVTLRGNIYINGSVTGSAVAVFGDIIVNGKVLGDAVTVTGRITVGQNGKVLGDTVEALGGTVSGNRDYSYNYNYRYDYKPNINIRPINRTVNAILSFFGAVTIFLLASIVYVIMPRRIEVMVDTIEPNFGRRIGIGALTVIGSPIAMVIVSIVLAITIIGILVIPFAWVAFLVFILVALVPAYVFIGKRTIALFGSKKASAYAGLAAGIFVIWLMNTILSFGGVYTGWLRTLIFFFVSVLGAGSIVDYLFTIRKMKKAYPGGYAPQDDRYSHQYTQGTELPPPRSVDANNEDNTDNNDNK
jgi:hypothetical protein